jgi:hypothetical protein
MNCKEARANLIESVRSGAPRDSALSGHLEVCAGCSRVLDYELALHSALASLATETVSTLPPDNLEARLLAEFDATARIGRRGQTTRQSAPRWLLPVAAALAASLVGALLIRQPAPPHVAVAPAVDQPFVQIPYVASRAPYERAEVMRMNVPLTALIAAGFEVHSPDIGAAVSADVLVGQDGRALAIRLVPSSIPNPDRRLNQ